MKITCVACQSRFQLDKTNIHVTGSLVKCTRCHFIFMTQLTDYDEIVCQDTNIHQSILNDLLEMETSLSAEAVIEEPSEKSNSSRMDRIRTIEDYEEKAIDLTTKKVDSIDLPDLSAFEEMIDWDELPDSEEISGRNLQTNNRTQEIDGDV